MGGMITATVLAIFFIPVFFVVVRARLQGRRRARAAGPRRPAAKRRAGGIGGRGRPCLIAACSRRRWPRSLAVAGCSMIPTYERPAAPVPATYPLETTPAVAPSGPAAADVEWQRFFADPRLQRLIELALVNNRDLRIAVLNIEQARALYDVRRADELADARHRRQRRPRRHQQRQHRHRLHRRRRGRRLRARSLRPRPLAERGGAQPVPGDRGGEKGGADQPGRQRRDDLPRPAGRRRAARRHPADAGDARGIDPPHQAALRQRRLVRARLPAVGIAARRRARRARR